PLPVMRVRPLSAKMLGGEAIMNWLFKEEPSSYSFQEFTRDGRTVWAGVKNPLAQKHLRSIKKGDRIFYYHTGNEKAVIGIARAAGDAYPDRKDKTGKAVVVDVVHERALARPVIVSQIKGSKMGRLSSVHSK